jgi:hypothetical protein
MIENNTESEIRAVCNEVAEMLIEKNRSYGDSALNPLRCFSKEASGIEQLNVRMDDKLSRLLRGNGNNFGEDVERDLMGYLVLKRVAVRRIAVNKAVDTAPSNSPVEMSAASHQNHATLQADIDRRTVASPPTPGRFVKPTATTAKEILAREESTRDSYGEHH